MNKLAKDIVMLAAAGTAGYCAYKWMSPEDKNNIKSDFHRTVKDINDVKQDVAGMTGTIRNTF